MKALTFNKKLLKVLTTLEMGVALTYLITQNKIFVITLCLYYLVRLILSFSSAVMNKFSNTLAFNMQENAVRLNPALFELRLMTISLIAASLCAWFGAGIVCTVIVGHLIIVEFLYLTCDFSLYESFYDHLESRL